jgi:hypothetical protein
MRVARTIFSRLSQGDRGRSQRLLNTRVELLAKQRGEEDWHPSIRHSALCYRLAIPRSGGHG